MDILVCDNFTALLRDECAIDAFLATCEILSGTFFRTYLNNYFLIFLKASENILRVLPFP